MTALLGCIIAPAGACAWSNHGLKHFPYRGMTREHTKNPNPARYLAGVDIQALEAGTIAVASESRRCSPTAHAEYARDTGAVIGWDDGDDARISYVECSGGLAGGRAYHGRPMHHANRKLDGLSVGGLASENSTRPSKGRGGAS